MNVLRTAALTSAFAILISIYPLHAKTLNPTATTVSARISGPEIAILAAIAAIDKNEILLSIFAANKKPGSGVADFAKMMIDQHGSNLTQIYDMASKLHALPLKGMTAEDIKIQGTKLMNTLGGLQGEQFDKAYVDAMVKGHEAALKLIDDKLMKLSRSQEIKTFLTDTRAAVVEHLDHAKKLQEEIKS